MNKKNIALDILKHTKIGKNNDSEDQNPLRETAHFFNPQIFTPQNRTLHQLQHTRVLTPHAATFQRYNLYFLFFTFHTLLLLCNLKISYFCLAIRR